MIRSRHALFALGATLALAALVDCSDILGINPTIIIPDPPPSDTGCIVSLKKIAGGQMQVVLLAGDDNGVFWATQRDAESGDVFGFVGNALVTVSANEASLQGLAVNADYVFFSAWNRPGGGQAAVHAWARAGGVMTSVGLQTANNAAGGLAADSSSLYFGSFGVSSGGGIYSLALPLVNGETPTKLASNVSSPYRVVVDSTHVYYDELADDFHNATAVSAVALDGGAVTSLAKNDSVTDLAAAGGLAFWTAGGQNVAKRAALGGGPIAAVASVNNPQSIAIDPVNNWLYMVTGDQGNGFSDIVRAPLNGTNNPAPQSCVGKLIYAGPMVWTGTHLYFSAAAADGWAIYDAVPTKN